MGSGDFLTTRRGNHPTISCYS